MITKSAISLLFVCCLASLSVSAPLEESAIKLGAADSRAAFCQRILGIEVCVDAMINGTELRVIFKVAGATIFDKALDATAPEYCVTKLGVKVCLKAKFSGSNVCFEVRGSAPFVGSTSVNLGCINF